MTLQVSKKSMKRRRLSRALRYIVAKPSLQCVTLEITLKVPGGIEFSVPCIEGLTTVADILAVARYRAPNIRTIDELELLQGGQTLDNEHVVSEYFNDKTEVIARIVAADENEDPFLVSYFDEEIPYHSPRSFSPAKPRTPTPPQTKIPEKIMASFHLYP